LLGKCYIETGNYSESSNIFFQLKSILTNYSDYIDYHIAKTFYKKGEFDKAEYWYKKFGGKLRKSLFSDNAQIELLYCYLNLNEYDKIVSLKYKAFSHEYAYIVAKAYEALKEYGKSSTNYRKILSSDVSGEFQENRLKG